MNNTTDARKMENETVRLKLTARSSQRRDAWLAELVSGLRAGRIANLPKSTGKGNRAITPQPSVYFEGKAGVNFTGKNKRAILVHASGEQVDRLLGRLEGSMRSLAGVSLEVDSLRFGGSRAARSTLARLSGIILPSDSDTLR